jgi:hypothetical protein
MLDEDKEYPQFAATIAQRSISDIVDMFRRSGWKCRKSSWFEYEAECDWAELALFEDGEVVIHGEMLLVEENGLKVMDLFTKNEFIFSAEFYDEYGKLLSEFKSTGT